MRRLFLILALVIAVAVAAVSIRSKPSSRKSESQAPQTRNASQDVKIVSGPTVSYVSAHHAVVQWMTDRPATTQLRYGMSESQLDKSERARGIGTNHRIMLSRLKSDTTYHFQVASSDGHGAPATSATTSFTTNNRGEHPTRFPKKP